MTLDLSLIKQGAKLHLRDGSVLVCGKHARVCTEYIHDDYGDVWFLSGSKMLCEPNHPRDIIRIEPAPEPVKIVGYINVNESNLMYAYSTLADAHECRSPNRIDCLEITYTVGQGATVRSVFNDA